MAPLSRTSNGLSIVFATGAFIGFSLGAVAGSLITDSHADPGSAVVTDEDSPAFDCRLDGNRICGPTNDQGVPAGRYDTGFLIESWSSLVARGIVVSL